MSSSAERLQVLKRLWPSAADIADAQWIQIKPFSNPFSLRLTEMIMAEGFQPGKRMSVCMTTDVLAATALLEMSS